MKTHILDNLEKKKNVILQLQRFSINGMLHFVPKPPLYVFTVENLR